MLPPLYLTLAAISYLTQLILAALIAAYLLYLTRREYRQGQLVPHTWLFTGFFAAVTLFALLGFGDAAWLPPHRFYVGYLRNIVVAVALIFLVQFAYHFPTLAPGQKLEARLTLGVTLLYALWELGIALDRLRQLAAWRVIFRPRVVDYPPVLLFVWLLIVLLRQTVRVAEGPGTWWQKLWRPRGAAAQTARALVLVFALLLGLSLVQLAHAEIREVSDTARDLTLSLGLLYALFAFALVYFNYLPAATTFMIKLVGVTLVLVLTLLNSAGWVMTVAYRDNYPGAIFPRDQQTFRFTPNGAGGYAIAEAPFHFERELGVNLDLQDGAPVKFDLPFVFPFYDQTWSALYIVDDGAVSFGGGLAPLKMRATRYRYGPLPAILLSPLYFSPLPDSGVFAHSAADQLTLTWSQMAVRDAAERRYTCQLVLYATGAFDLTYNGLAATPVSSLLNADRDVWPVGITPGISPVAAHQIQFNADLPYTSRDDGAIVTDYYLLWRSYLQRPLWPLLYFIIGSSLFVVLGLPWFFRRNIVQPLHNLRDGIQAVNAGDLTITLPVYYPDEIGLLTQSFNIMATTVRQHAAELVAAERKFRTVADFSYDWEYWIAPEGHLIYVSPACERITGYPPAAFMTDPQLLIRIAHPDDVAVIAQHTRVELQSTAVHDLEFRLITRDGAVRWIAHVCQPVHTPDGAYLGRRASNRDITAHKQIEFENARLAAAEHAARAEAATLAVRLTEVEETERRRLAYELHDAVSQTLFTASLMAEAMPLAWEQDPAQGRRGMAEVQRLTRGALAEMRALLVELVPATLTQKPLGVLLTHLTRAVASHSRIAIELQATHDQVLPSDVQIVFYRIAQESLNNIVKHAQASRVDVALTGDAQHARLTARDNGIGFDPQHLPAGHLGLGIMQERAASINATLTLSSQPGHGTVISLSWLQT